ncbi:MAG: hypothetical protein WC380_11230 [Pedobacter sp.]
MDLQQIPDSRGSFASFSSCREKEVPSGMSEKKIKWINNFAFKQTAEGNNDFLKSLNRWVCFRKISSKLCLDTVISDFALV